MDENKNKATIIKSNKGINDKVFYLGYDYIKDGKNKDGSIIYYSCARYKEIKCTGRLVRDLKQPEGDGQLTVTKEHTHIGDGRIVGKAVAMKTLKRKATDNNDSARNVVAKLNENMDVSTAASLASSKSLLQSVRRSKPADELPSNPQSLEELVIPDKLKYVNGQQFLLYDSGPGPNRILIFATKRNLELLARADVISMDGTFYIVPPLFDQLYTLQGRVDGWYVPLLYILAPNRTKKMYEESFKVIVDNVPDCQPKFVITDFEIGAINAAKKYFSNAKLHGCFFHLCQSVWRHVQALGLQKRYVDDADFALKIRQLLAFAFVPPEDVPKHFTTLCNTEFWSADSDDEDQEKIRALLAYFESTYIGVETRNKLRRKAVAFPSSMWSVYEITILGIPRTNNSLEAWHGVIKRSIGAGHVSIFKFIVALQSEQNFQELRMSKIDSGQNPEMPQRKYRLMDERIKAMVSKYDNSADFKIENYLNTLAHNIYF